MEASHMARRLSSRLTGDERVKLINQMAQFGGATLQDVRRLRKNPRVWEAMWEVARQHDVFRLIHSMWTPLDDLIENVRGYDGVNGAKIDAALKTARENGTMKAIEALRAEKPEDFLVAPVITVNRPTIHETLLFGRFCAQQGWGDKYTEWMEAYAIGVDEKRVELILGVRPFVPDELAIRIVDFGANWDPKNGNVLKEIQQAQAARLAGFEVIFAMSQHPEWVRRMDGKTVPYALAASLLLSVPYRGARSHSPYVWHDGVRVRFHGYHVDDRFHRHSMPLVQEFKD